MADRKVVASARTRRARAQRALWAASLAATLSCGRVGVELLPDGVRSDAALEPADGAVVPSEDGSALDAASRDVGPDAATHEAGNDAAQASDGALHADASACAADPSCSLCSSDPSAYVPVTNCGVGYCRDTNTPSRCAAGSEVACLPGMPRSRTDSACDGIDDDCDGAIDEDYVATSTSCGRGVCARTGLRTCQGGAVSDSCMPGMPASALDDASGSGNGRDDDCDGAVDEDVPGCDTTPRSFEAGNYPNLAVPAGCSRVTVRLWGAGGAGGADVGVLGTGGEGAAGGYTTLTTSVTGSLLLLVGQGAVADCSSPGINPGASTYNGGTGGPGSGAPGGDGAAAGGGAGGVPSTGSAGGRGHYGGGGGGQGAGGVGFGQSGEGGGGGAATVFLMSGTRLAVAGGGGGGGGSQALSPLGTQAAAGGHGGPGCAGVGLAETGNGGGGGGGGVCIGTISHAGAGRTPAFGGDVPAGRAAGGGSGCVAGGAGYAIVTFSR